MGILSSLFRSRDKPSDRTSGSSYSFFMGGSTSGKRVNERTAMQMTAVYSCVRILSEAVASLPLQFYRYTNDGGKEKAVNHSLYFLLHDEPNPEMTDADDAPAFVGQCLCPDHPEREGRSDRPVPADGGPDVCGSG